MSAPLRVGVAGFGKMGAAMAAQLLETGAEVLVWNRDSSVPRNAGMVVAETPRNLAKRCDTIISSLFDDKAVRDVFERTRGLIAGGAGKLFIEMSTVRPETQQHLASAVEQAGGAFIECPVSGITGPARSGELVGLAGGDVTHIERAIGTCAALSTYRAHRADRRRRDREARHQPPPPRVLAILRRSHGAHAPSRQGLAVARSALQRYRRDARGSVLADMLTREQVRSMVKAMVRKPRGDGPRDRPRGGKEAARTALATLRKMINWGMREELLKRETNPATGMEDNLPKKKEKDTVLSLDEARIVWRAAETLGYPFGPTYQLIMLTGCRPGEWAEHLWPWIDFKQAITVIPADAYKTDHVHIVPLVPKAIEILERTVAYHRGRRGEYIFSGTDGVKPLAGWTKAQTRMRRAICAVNGQPLTKLWTPHDLRRTVATRIGEQLGVGGEQLIKRVLGHSDGSVTATYNRYGYVKEMRRVLEQWAADLTGVSLPAASPNVAPTDPENRAAGIGAIGP